MANTVQAMGWINPRLRTGGTPGTRTLQVSSDYTIDFYPGQLLIMDPGGTGWIEHPATTNSASGFVGVCMSFLPNPNGQVVATGVSKDTEIQAITDLANTTWEIGLSLSSSSGQTIIGLNAVAGGSIIAVNTTRRQSAVTIGTVDTTTGTCRILAFATYPDNEKDSDNARVVVQFNEDKLRENVDAGI